MKYHAPVMLNEVIENLNIVPGNKYIDTTLGDGGHTLEILKKGGDVMGLDVNDYSLQRAVNRIASEKVLGKFTPVQGNFREVDTLAQKNGFGEVNGILFDLGYSSSQLDEDPLGLTFLKDEPLDMRLDNTLGVTAADLVNTLTERDLARLIFEYSDEHLAKRFARAIVRSRSLEKIRTTAQLAKILADEASPGYERGRINPATRTFQALRIAVNDEIRNLELSLPRAARLLLPGSRMIVISFHSLEDKVAKHFGRSAQPCIKSVHKKALEPTENETSANPRARSAKMRVFEKC